MAQAINGVFVRSTNMDTNIRRYAKRYYAKNKKKLLRQRRLDRRPSNRLSADDLSSITALAAAKKASKK